MKQQINEIKRMQQLAGIITESQIKEAVDDDTKLRRAVEERLGRELTDEELNELNLKRAALTGLAAATLGLGGMKGYAGTPKEPTPIVQQASVKLSTQDKQDWDKFQNWLKDNDYAGNSKMDSDAFRQGVLDQYKRENPKTKVADTNFVKAVQKYMIDYRNQLIDKDKKGAITISQGKFKEKDNYDDFMPAVLKMDKTGTDGKIGEFTSQWKFKDFLMKGDGGVMKRISYAPDLAKL
jgi:hypothetical protein